MDNTNVKHRPSRMGENNPMYGRHHTDEAKRKQSEAAIRRNQMYKKALEQQHHVSMDEFLNNESTKSWLSKIIREEIEKLL